MQVELSSHYCICMLKPHTLHLAGLIVCIVILCLMPYLTFLLLRWHSVMILEMVLIIFLHKMVN